MGKKKAKKKAKGSYIEQRIQYWLEMFPGGGLAAAQAAVSRELYENGRCRHCGERR